MTEPLHILIVDDDDVDRMSVRRQLKSVGSGITMVEATCGREALERVREENFNCIFLDYLLPDSDGLSVLTDIRGESIDTPVIMLTGHGDERLAVELMRAGAADYLPKGQLSTELLEHSLRNALRLHGAEQERKRAQEALQRSNKKIIDILESISDAFFALDGDWRFTYLNQQAERLLQAERQTLLDGNIWERLPNLAPWFRESLTTAMTSKQPVSCDGEYELIGKWLETQVYPGQDGISVYFRDITERKKAADRLNYLANYDALTDLPNRVLFVDRLTQALSRAPWHERRIAVMFCDLDRFKIINDSLGHNVGDHLLKNVAQRFLSCVRNGDTVARLGGDEFVILLNDMAKSGDAAAIANKIIESVAEPFVLDGHELFVTVSIGISLNSEDGTDPKVLLKNADTAMYRAKDLGKNGFHFYSRSLEVRASDRLGIENALRRALERHELYLLYQPQVNLTTGRIVGAEALLRWQNSGMGLMSPTEFLPVAEESGLIIPIGEWVLSTACQQAKVWHEAGFSDLRVAVNISDRQFHHSGLAEGIRKVLAESGLAAEFLDLELTEDIVMKNTGKAAELIHELRSAGVKLAIDDFGTGYSSFGHLKSFPIHTVKIDRSFISDLSSDNEDGAIVEAMLAMAHKLKLNVIAEGVETQQQRDFLMECDCDEMQGFFFSRPVSSDDFLTLLDENKKTRTSC